MPEDRTIDDALSMPEDIVPETEMELADEALLQAEATAKARVFKKDSIETADNVKAKSAILVTNSYSSSATKHATQNAVDKAIAKAKAQAKAAKEKNATKAAKEPKGAKAADAVYGALDPETGQRDVDFMKNNSLGLKILTGDGRFAKSKLNADGQVTGAGYTTADAYLGPKGHYYIGPGRRRIGAGFGPRRRRSKTPEPEHPKHEREKPLSPNNAKLEEECLAKMEKAAVRKDESTIEQGVETATLKGTVINADTGRGEAGATVVAVDFDSGDKHTTTTDENGLYVFKNLRRCGFYQFQITKKGFIPNTGEHECAEPLILFTPQVYQRHGISAVLPEGQMRAVLNWQANDNYLKDLDLHLLIPGERKVLVKGYKKHDNAKADAEVKERTDLKHERHTVKKYLSKYFALKHKKYTKTDLAKNHDPVLDKEREIFWDNKGWEHYYPYAHYEVDHGSMGVKGGGPEIIRIYKELPKQYLFFVDCWSCDEFEDTDGLDQKRKLTYQALNEFFRHSHATVSLLKGDKQVFCRNINSARGRPTVRWDAIMIDSAQIGSNATHTENGRFITSLNEFHKHSPPLTGPLTTAVFTGQRPWKVKREEEAEVVEGEKRADIFNHGRRRKDDKADEGRRRRKDSDEAKVLKEKVKEEEAKADEKAAENENIPANRRRKDDEGRRRRKD
jgi:hypothetical protein